jgi:hypothetical protein
MLPELPQLRLVLQQQVQLLGAPAAALTREVRAATERHGSTRDVLAVAAQAQELQQLLMATRAELDAGGRLITS